jgi:hypothetical protein
VAKYDLSEAPIGSTCPFLASLRPTVSRASAHNLAILLIAASWRMICRY